MSFEKIIEKMHDDKIIVRTKQLVAKLQHVFVDCVTQDILKPPLVLLGDGRLYQQNYPVDDLENDRTVFDILEDRGGKSPMTNLKVKSCMFFTEKCRVTQLIDCFCILNELVQKISAGFTNAKKNDIARICKKSILIFVCMLHDRVTKELMSCPATISNGITLDYKTIFTHYREVKATLGNFSLQPIIYNWVIKSAIEELKKVFPECYGDHKIKQIKDIKFAADDATNLLKTVCADVSVDISYVALILPFKPVIDEKLGKQLLNMVMKCNSKFEDGIKQREQIIDILKCQQQAMLEALNLEKLIIKEKPDLYLIAKVLECKEKISEKSFSQLYNFIAKNYNRRDRKVELIAKAILDKHAYVSKFAEFVTYTLEFVCYDYVKTPLMNMKTLKNKYIALWSYLLGKVQEDTSWRNLCSSFIEFMLEVSSHHTMLLVPYDFVLHDHLVSAATENKEVILTILLKNMIKYKLKFRDKNSLDRVLCYIVNKPIDETYQKIFTKIWWLIRTYKVNDLQHIERICCNNLTVRLVGNFLCECNKRAIRLAPNITFECFAKISKEFDMIKFAKENLKLVILDTPEKIIFRSGLAFHFICYLFDKEPDNLLNLLRDKSSLSTFVWRALFLNHHQNTISQRKIISIVPKNILVSILQCFTAGTIKVSLDAITIISKQLQISDKKEMQIFLDGLEEQIQHFNGARKNDEDLYKRADLSLTNVLVNFDDGFKYAKAQQYTHILNTFIYHNAELICQVDEVIIKLLPECIIVKILKQNNPGLPSIHKLLEHRLADCFCLALRHHNDFIQIFTTCISAGNLTDVMLGEIKLSDKDMDRFFTYLVSSGIPHRFLGKVLLRMSREGRNQLIKKYLLQLEEIMPKIYASYSDENLAIVFQIGDQNLRLSLFNWLITKADFRFVDKALCSFERSWVIPGCSYMRAIQDNIGALNAEQTYNLIKILANNHALWLKATFPRYLFAKQFSFIEFDGEKFHAVLQKISDDEVCDPQIFNFLCSPCVKVKNKFNLLENFLNETKNSITYNKVLIQIISCSLITPLFYLNDSQVGIAMQDDPLGDFITSICKSLADRKFSGYEKILLCKKDILEFMWKIYHNFTILKDCHQVKYNDPLLMLLFELFSCNLSFKDDINEICCFWVKVGSSIKKLLKCISGDAKFQLYANDLRQLTLLSKQLDKYVDSRAEKIIELQKSSIDNDCVMDSVKIELQKFPQLFVREHKVVLNNQGLFALLKCAQNLSKPTFQVVLQEIGVAKIVQLFSKPAFNFIEHHELLKIISEGEGASKKLKEIQNICEVLCSVNSLNLTVNSLSLTVNSLDSSLFKNLIECFNAFKNGVWQIIREEYNGSSKKNLFFSKSGKTQIKFGKYNSTLCEQISAFQKEWVSEKSTDQQKEHVKNALQKLMQSTNQVTKLINKDFKINGFIVPLAVFLDFPSKFQANIANRHTLKPNTI